MRFRFQNIGPIEDADLELGDLTVIAGRNNTGKTYIVYTLYGFLRNWAEFAGRLTPSKPSPLFGASTELPAAFSRSTDSTASISRARIEDIRDRALKDAAHLFSARGIRTVFSSPRAAFPDATFSAKATDGLPADGQKRVFRFPSGTTLSATYGDDVVLSLDGNNEGRTPVNDLLLRVALPDLPVPFILSAERFGISLFYKELDFTKNRLVEMLQQLGDEKEVRSEGMPYLFLDRAASRYALPVKDNIDYTRSIPQLRNEQSELSEQRLDLAIKGLMDGYYTANADEIRFRSGVKGRTFNIPLHLASSSARGLSDLYFYSRHTASQNHLLIMDEPESHLDTTNQLLLTRILAHFVRAGIKVLITTHSDYLIKEINNLVMLGHLDATRRRTLGRRLGYSRDEQLPPESLKAYVADGNNLQSCTVDHLGIDMPVFDDTIDRVNRVANELAIALSD